MARLLVAWLFFGLGVVDRVLVDARRGPRLEAAQLEAELFQVLGQLDGRNRVVGAGGVVQFPNEDPSPGGRTRGQDDALGLVAGSGVGNHALADPVFNDQLINDRLAQGQVGRVFNGPLHFLMIVPLVGLGPQGADSRALARVQHPHLDVGLVDILAHFAAKGVDLADDRPFGRTAD